MGPRQERVGKVSATQSGMSVESRECRTPRPCKGPVHDKLWEQ